MRITNQMISNNSLRNMQKTMANVDNRTTQMETGKKITKASEDPVVAVRALKLRTMVTQLEQYKDKDFFDRHRKIYFTTDRRREYEVFAVMSVNVRKFKYWKFIMARDEKDYDEFAQKVLEHSMWNIGGKPKYKEQMLMLSTCDNGKEDDWRIVVVGKEI